MSAMRTYRVAELGIVEPDKGSVEAVTWHKTIIKSRFTEGGALQLSADFIKRMNPAVILRMPMPTILRPERRQAITEAIIVGGLSRLSIERQQIIFARSQRVGVSVGNSLVLRLLPDNIENESGNRLDAVSHGRGQTKSYSLYLPRIAEVHNRLVESRRHLPIGPHLRIDTHARHIIRNDEVIGVEPSIVKILSALAVSPSHFADHSKLMHIMGVPSEGAVRLAAQRARRLLREHALSEYDIESERGEGYRLRTPYESHALEPLSLANEAVNP